MTATALSACDHGLGSGGAAVIDARADSALNFLYPTYPGTQDLGTGARTILAIIAAVYLVLRPKAIPADV